MKTILIHTLIMLFGMIFLSGNSGVLLETKEISEQQSSALHELVIKQIDGEWRVVRKDDEWNCHKKVDSWLRVIMQLVSV